MLVVCESTPPPHLDGVLYVDESHHIECLGHLVGPLPYQVEGGGGDGLGGQAARTVTTVHTSLQQQQWWQQQQQQQQQQWWQQWRQTHIHQPLSSSHTCNNCVKTL
jgi:hypothetical protein